MYLISSCLVGINCRYNGTSSTVPSLLKKIEKGEAISICPEELARLPTPRIPCEIIRDSKTFKVISKSGVDYTIDFIKGALETLKICKRHKIKTAILKSRSPSCGFGKVYNGKFNGELIEGNGLTADLLVKNHIKVCNETNWIDELD